MKEKIDYSSVSGIWIILLSLVGVAILVMIGYWIFYKISINKSLHSDKPKKRMPPQNIIIAVLGVLLVISVGYSTQRIVHDYAPQNTTREYFAYYYEDNRGKAFDALFDDKDIAQQGGYLLTVHNENGFEISQLSGGRATSSLMPDNIFRIRYTNELPTPNEDEHLDFTFKFLYQDAKNPNATFIGYGFSGKYRTIYISYNCYGRYNLRIESALRIRVNKTDEVEPFAQNLFEMQINQS